MIQLSPLIRFTTINNKADVIDLKLARINLRDQKGGDWSLLQNIAQLKNVKNRNAFSKSLRVKTLYDKSTM